METVTNEQKSLFASFLEALESKEKKAQAERELQEEKYLIRTQRIYEFHERQRREAAELRQCLQYVGEHAHLLETALRAADSAGGVPLNAALVRQASALQRSMQQCICNAVRIRDLLAAAHRPHMDTLLAKMEAELGRWSAFAAGASHALVASGALLDNLHNLIAVQRRCVSEVSNSELFTSLCEDSATAETSAAGGPRRAPSAACSTPIPAD
ncbi:hypothetical protein EVAR_93978_1 [Eumeta japonica]|uniref:Uncharacterized protein n=1 Tax=Eumeta variegata TaxID=151549 RepID=A0A4C1TP95_EUMVA|nr:hypothetical protein EVAR_93978_1 [Eumeta japonica]